MTPATTTLAAQQGHTAHPLVSVGIPAYNGAAFLAEALESALAQTYTPIEIIVSDDGSTDGTEAIGRRFAAADPRVRYIRAGGNTGAADNFRRVLEEAQGVYFTWLAQDDVLSDREYISTTVGYLKQHPDVVACATGLSLLDYEVPSSVSSQFIPELAPERPWPEARREFFRWPQSNVISALYGMFRREPLARVPIVGTTYKGRPNAAYWEIPVLAALSGYGKMVALPACLRAYRISGASDGDHIYQAASRYDLFVLGLRAKLLLLRSAWNLPLPPQERAGLVRMALANLFRGNFRRPWDYQSTIQAREHERVLLRGVASERAALIRLLRDEIEKRRKIVRALGRDGEVPSTSLSDEAEASSDDLAARAAEPAQRQPRRQRGLRVRGLLADAFQPPAPWQVALYRELREDVGQLRQHCAAQEQAIQQLHAEAEALLQIINTPRG